MIHSMTGYGLAKFQDDRLTVSVEIRSLNSKFLDLNLRIPKVLNEKEPDLRKIITDQLIRGKVSVNIEFIQINPEGQAYNKALFKHYFEELKDLADEVNASSDEIFRIALSSPDVLNTDEGNMDAKNWEVVRMLMDEALEKCKGFRKTEGEAIHGKLHDYIQQIHAFLQQVIDLEPERTKNVREKMMEKLNEMQSTAVDENRFEQELIYYIEKLDIQEEIVRLKKHLEHFNEVLAEQESQGKKLGFISQEIGREINTIGSKANDAAIQKLVVGMKDELEKIKEQVLNAV